MGDKSFQQVFDEMMEEVTNTDVVQKKTEKDLGVVQDVVHIHPPADARIPLVPFESSPPTGEHAKSLIALYTEDIDDLDEHELELYL